MCKYQGEVGWDTGNRVGSPDGARDEGVCVWEGGGERRSRGVVS